MGDGLGVEGCLRSVQCSATHAEYLAKVSYVIKTSILVDITVSSYRNSVGSTLKSNIINYYEQVYLRLRLVNYVKDVVLYTPCFSADDVLGSRNQFVGRVRVH